MKKGTLAALALALPLTIGSALATPLTPEYIRGYGDVYDNKVGNQSSPYGWFSLAGLNLTSDSVITLTLNYADIGGEYFGRNNSKLNKESWLIFTDNSYAWDWLIDTIDPVSAALDPALTAVSIEFSSTHNAEMFGSILKHHGRDDTLDFWLYEGTRDQSNRTDSFTLKSASLSVTSAAVIPTPNDPVPTTPVPEPESYALLVAGLGMLTAVSRRNRQKRS